MRKCPTCQETFGDEKKFCQKDGTPLVDVVEPPPLDDPFKTVIGAPPPATSPNISGDEMKTFVVSSENKEKEEDILQIPEVFDPMKTMVVSDPIKYKEPTTTAPPNDPVVPAPEPPKFNEPRLSEPVFSDMSGNEPPKVETPSPFSPPPFDPPKPVDPPIPNPFSAPPTMVETPKVEAAPLPGESAPTESPFDKPFSPSIPSPFDPPKFNDPVATPSPFNEPVASPPVFNEPEPMKMDDPKPFGSSPFDPPAASFGQPTNDPFNQPNDPFNNQPANDPFNQPVQDNAGWNPLSPPASSGWGDSPVANNMSGIPPAPVGAGSGSPSSVLAIISLVAGILGFLSIAITLIIPFCGIIPFGLGIAAAVLGFLARSRAKSDPTQYGGAGLGLVGLILGVLSILGPILVVVLYMVLFGAMQFVPR